MAQFPSTTAADGIWTLKKVRRAILGDNWPPLVAPDEFFANTVLLLNANNASDAGQNNTFLDSSSNTHTITRNGNVTQGSFSPFSVDDGKWGNYFDGNDYLDVPDDLSFAMGTGDFTIECWIFRASGLTLFDTRDADDSAGFAVLVNGSLLQFRTNANTQISGGTVSNNVWHHVALCRSSGTTKLFFNGTQIGSDYSDSNNYSADNFTIGRVSYTGLNFFKGYISNLRVIKGTALYTSAFTPSTAPLTAISGTSLLTCQSNRFVDNSSNAHSITVNGDTKVVPFSPFPQTTAYDASTNGGSGYFDGTGDYLTVASGGAFGTNSWTIEGWVYRASTGTTRSIFGHNTALTSSTGFTLVVNSSEQLGAYWGSAYQATVSSFPSRQWVHVAATYDGTNLRLFVNGVLGATSAETINFTTADYFIGSNINSQEWDGYISNMRIDGGTAVYTSAFTPPTAPLTDITNTELLCNFTNASIIDATGKNVLETVGNAQVDTTTVKYGTGAMEFDGTGDKLTTNGASIGDFGTGDFTIEAWVNADALSGYNSIIADDTYSSGSTPNAWCLYLDGTSLDGWKGGSSILTGGTLTVGQWHHVAWTRSSGTMYLFLDGQQVATASDSTSFNHGDIIVASNVGNYYFDGYLDDLRITKGIARYTANFTPPVAELPIVGE